MSELNAQYARHAIVTALQILRYTPPEKLADLYEIVHGHRIDNARAAIHAGMYDWVRREEREGMIQTTYHDVRISESKDRYVEIRMLPYDQEGKDGEVQNITVKDETARRLRIALASYYRMIDE